jgi:hypothetical protein
MGIKNMLMNQHKLLIYTGRISGLLVIAFFLSFFVGEGLPDIAKGSGKTLLQFLPFTLLSLIGYLVAWFNPLWGGRMLIAGAILLAFYFFYNGDTGMALVYGLPSLLVGLTFIAAVNKEMI